MIFVDEESEFFLFREVKALHYRNPSISESHEPGKANFGSVFTGKKVVSFTPWFSLRL
jgi:hypothetical protein